MHDDIKGNCFYFFVLTQKNKKSQGWPHPSAGWRTPSPSEKGKGNGI